MYNYCFIVTFAIANFYFLPKRDVFRLKNKMKKEKNTSLILES